VCVGTWKYRTLHCLFCDQFMPLFLTPHEDLDDTPAPQPNDKAEPLATAAGGGAVLDLLSALEGPADAVQKEEMSSPVPSPDAAAGVVPTAQQLGVSTPGGAIMDTGNVGSWFRKLCVSPSGVLFENTILQVKLHAC
jgi:hypothetical protein